MNQPIMLTIVFSLMFAQLAAAQTTIVKNKVGKTIGYIKKKKNGDQVFYDKSHNKTGYSKKVGKATTYYDKYGKKVYTTQDK